MRASLNTTRILFAAQYQHWHRIDRIDGELKIKTDSSIFEEGTMFVLVDVNSANAFRQGRLL